MKQKSPKWKLLFSRSILKKTILLYVFLIAIPLLLLYVWLHSATSQQASEDSGTQLMVSLHSLSDTMDEVFRSVDFLQSQMQATPALSETVFTLTPGSQRLSYSQYMLRSSVSMQLYQSFIHNDYLCSLSLYSPHSDTLFENRIGETRLRTESPSKAAAYTIMGDTPSASPSWKIEFSAEQGAYQLVRRESLYWSTHPSQKVFACSAVAMPTLVKRLRSYMPDPQVELMIPVREGEYIPITGSELSSAQQSARSGPASQGWTTYQHQGETYLRAVYYSSYMEWYYVATAPLHSFTSSMSVINTYLSYYLTVLLAILVLFILILLFQIVVPLRKLSHTMRQAEKGDLSVRAVNNRSDELGYIGHRLNVLLDSIEHLIYENYESRMRKNEFELKYIQTQLKEHFIYNTLDSIHWIANKHRVPQISDIIFNLSRFFRLMLNHGKPTVTIRQAVEISQCYIDLMNVRMEETISCELEVDPELMDFHVLKYLFQPILENAIVHGIRPKGGGTVTLRFAREGESRICYTVRDDGIGIAPDMLDEIRYNIQHEITKDQYFALVTLNCQLRLYFGQDFTFAIDSVPGRGTCVSLSFPYHTPADKPLVP